MKNLKKILLCLVIFGSIYAAKTVVTETPNNSNVKTVQQDSPKQVLNGVNDYMDKNFLGGKSVAITNYGHYVFTLSNYLYLYFTDSYNPTKKPVQISVPGVKIYKIQVKWNKLFVIGRTSSDKPAFMYGTTLDTSKADLGIKFQKFDWTEGIMDWAFSSVSSSSSDIFAYSTWIDTTTLTMNYGVINDKDMKFVESNSFTYKLDSRFPYGLANMAINSKKEIFVIDHHVGDVYKLDWNGTYANTDTPSAELHKLSKPQSNLFFSDVYVDSHDKLYTFYNNNDVTGCIVNLDIQNQMSYVHDKEGVMIADGFEINNKMWFKANDGTLWYENDNGVLTQLDYLPINDHSGKYVFDCKEVKLTSTNADVDKDSLVLSIDNPQSPFNEVILNTEVDPSPIGPSTPVIPWTPIGPSTPITPWTPIGPSTPITPWTPIEPGIPITPWTPEEPSFPLNNNNLNTKLLVESLSIGFSIGFIAIISSILVIYFVIKKSNGQKDINIKPKDDVQGK